MICLLFYRLKLLKLLVFFLCIPIVLHATDRSKKLPIDILFIIHDSHSMLFKVAELPPKIKGFTQKLKAFDWRLGVITTHPLKATSGKTKSHFVSYQKQRFITPFDENPEQIVFHIIHSISRQILCDHFKILDEKKILRSSNHIYDESILEEVDRLQCHPRKTTASDASPFHIISNLIDNKNKYSEFLRPHTPLIIIIMTDNSHVESLPPAEELALKLKRSFTTQDTTAYGILRHTDNSIGSERCTSTDLSLNNEWAQQFIKLTNGRSQSLCDSSYLKTFDEILKKNLY